MAGQPSTARIPQPRVPTGPGFTAERIPLAHPPADAVVNPLPPPRLWSRDPSSHSGEALPKRPVDTPAPSIDRGRRARYRPEVGAHPAGLIALSAAVELASLSSANDDCGLERTGWGGCVEGWGIGGGWGAPGYVEEVETLGGLQDQASYGARYRLAFWQTKQ